MDDKRTPQDTKLYCIGIVSQYVRKYDDEGRLASLTADETVAYASTFFKFINEEGN